MNRGFSGMFGGPLSGGRLGSGRVWAGGVGLAALLALWGGKAAPAAPPRPNDGKPHTFVLGTNDFLLDGKPFLMRSGEMHPERIPREYWRHRIRMAKAMGLNVIAVYIFWSAHESAEGRYDFQSGNRDTARFLQLAKEEGMWVMLRPGPYCCGEWDLGGIPSYLLKDPKAKLRCMDPSYTRAVARYFHALAGVVRPYLVKNGGPILLVQIENEYGSYPRRDHDYLVWLRDLWLKEGVPGPFYTADGAAEHYLKGVTVPGVAIGLDTGTKEEHWELARRMNPGVPVFTSEVYPGWLRHWGEGDWKPNDISGLLKFYLNTGKSFNLYMFHGGSNFGLTAGANSGGKGGYQPDLTSYDYASPVSEQGRPTPAYYRYRKLLASYLPAEEQPPAPPAVIPTCAIPPVPLERWSDLWALLPAPLRREQPTYFEALDQNQGMMVYRATLPPGGERELKLEHANDYAQVFVNGTFVGTLDRRLGQHTISLPATDRPVPLEILVEGMGHINYSQAMEFDRKGLFGQVTVAGQPLSGWELFPLPLDGDLIVSAPKSRPAPGRPGGIFRGVFSLDEPRDTFWDLTPYQKGYVWINGHNLGRYWNIGPQYRLYCPAGWLKRGRNEIVILDLHQTTPRPVAGRSAPRE